jgi:hypothetical protein
MDDGLERPAPDLLRPEAADRDLGRILDRFRRHEVDERAATVVPDDAASEIQIPPDEDFLAWRESRGDAGPKRYERPGDRLPWTEHPDNPAFERYDWRPDLERRAQDGYAEHGFCAETLTHIDPVDDRNPGANCGEVARSVASTLDGCPRSAAALGEWEDGETAPEMEAWAGRPFEPEQPADTALDAIDRDLAARGDGAHGIVAGRRAGEVGHYFNIARIDGRSVVIDAQHGGSTLLPLEQGGRDYVHGAKLVSLQWMPLERKPHA